MTKVPSYHGYKQYLAAVEHASVGLAQACRN